MSKDDIELFLKELVSQGDEYESLSCNSEKFEIQDSDLENPYFEKNENELLKIWHDLNAKSKIFMNPANNDIPNSDLVLKLKNFQEAISTKNVLKIQKDAIETRHRLLARYEDIYKKRTWRGRKTLRNNYKSLAKIPKNKNPSDYVLNENGEYIPRRSAHKIIGSKFGLKRNRLQGRMQRVQNEVKLDFRGIQDSNIGSYVAYNRNGDYFLGKILCFYKSISKGSQPRTFITPEDSQQFAIVIVAKLKNFQKQIYFFDWSEKFIDRVSGSEIKFQLEVEHLSECEFILKNCNLTFSEHVEISRKPKVEKKAVCEICGEKFADFNSAWTKHVSVCVQATLKRKHLDEAFHPSQKRQKVKKKKLSKTITKSSTPKSKGEISQKVQNEKVLTPSRKFRKYPNKSGYGKRKKSSSGKRFTPGKSPKDARKKKIPSPKSLRKPTSSIFFKKSSKKASPLVGKKKQKKVKSKDGESNVVGEAAPPLKSVKENCSGRKRQLSSAESPSPKRVKKSESEQKEVVVVDLRSPAPTNEVQIYLDSLK